MLSLWSGEEDQHRVQSYLRCLEEGAKDCIKDLPSVIKERNKLAKVGLGWRWMEACPDSIAYLVRELGSLGWRVGLHLTNIHQYNFNGYGAQVVSPSDAGIIYRGLHGPAGVMNKTLKEIAGQRLVLWAPTDGAKLSAVMGELGKAMREGTYDFELALVVPYEPMPGCNDVNLIQELWNHVLMQKKNANIVKALQFFVQPVRCVFTGPVGPLHQLKSLAMFTLSSRGSSIPPSIHTWKVQLLEWELGHMIIVDAPMQHVQDIGAILCKAQVPGLLGWDTARRSPAHSVSAPRQVLCGYLDRNHVCYMDVCLIIKGFKAQIQIPGVYIGTQELFQDKTSLVIEYGDVQALEAFESLIQEAVIVSKRKALINTLAPKELFEPLLTLQMSQSPLTSVTCIRFRRALNLPNNIWLKPALTDLQMERARQQSIAANKPPKERAALALKTKLKIEGLTQVEHISVCREIMHKVCQSCLLSLTESNQDVIGPNEWAIDYRADGSFAQQVTVQLCSDDALKSLIMNIHGCGVRVGGRNLAIEVRSGHVAAECAGMLAANLVPSGGGPCL